MAVRGQYVEYVLEQLGRVAPISSRKMFGAVGLYCDGLFFALIDDDSVYFKVDDVNRAAFVARGMGAFMPYGDDSHVMQYYELPGEVLEDPQALRPWLDAAVDVARRKNRKKG